MKKVTVLFIRVNIYTYFYTDYCFFKVNNKKSQPVYKYILLTQG